MELITPDSREHWLKLRTEDVTSTESAALFGLSPWMTEFELWHRKKSGEIVSIDTNERMTWGTRLESAIANGIAEDQNWSIKPFKDYARLKDMRAGGSFDFMIVEDDQDSKPVGLLEIKNVDSLQFRDKWVVENGEVTEAPPHIEIQCQHQLMITGYPVLYLGALVGGNTVKLIKRTPDPVIIQSIKDKIENFWKSIDNNVPPSPDFEKDADFIMSLHNSSIKGKAVEIPDDPHIYGLVEEYRVNSAIIKEAETKKIAAKAELITMIGDADKAYGDLFTISAGMVGSAEVSYIRDGYRSFRINFKKVVK